MIHALVSADKPKIETNEASEFPTLAPNADSAIKINKTLVGNVNTVDKTPANSEFPLS